MKYFSTLIALALCLVATSCGDKGDNNAYYQAEMINHLANVDATEENPGTATMTTSVYEIIINSDKGTADVACSVTLPDGSTGTIDLRDLSCTYNSSTNVYTFKQTSSTSSKGKFVATGMTGKLDLNQSSDYSQTEFTCTVESHYTLTGTLSDYNFSDCTSKVTGIETGEEFTVADGEYIFTINSVDKETATVTIKGLYFEPNRVPKTIAYEGLTIEPTFYGYHITGENILPTTGGEASLAKYTLESLDAMVAFYGGYNVSYKIKDVAYVESNNFFDF